MNEFEIKKLVTDVEKTIGEMKIHEILMWLDAAPDLMKKDIESAVNNRQATTLGNLVLMALYKTVEQSISEARK